MNVLIHGYGEGAFETLRFKFDLSAAPPEIDPEAISLRAIPPKRKRRSASGVVLTGETRKTGPASEDNEVTITLHDLSQSEAVVLARKLLEYVSYLQETEAEAGA